MSIFEYQDDEALGKVTSVDTMTVVVEVEDLEQLKRLQVNRLAVLQSGRPGNHLIGLISQVTRKRSSLDTEEFPSEQNLCKVLLIGCLLDRVGMQVNVFRRTLECLPEINANCFALEGERLTQFMRVISQAVGDETSFPIGKYTLDQNATVFLNGNKLFQRHAFIGGSTGSGKSWTTAAIVEKVAELKSANCLLFDLHGEYAPLDCEGVAHYRIAGPADIANGRTIDDNVIYLPYWLLSYEALISLFVERSDQNAPNQSMVMAREINAVKEEYLISGGHDELLENFTVDSPVPFGIDKLLERLEEVNAEMVPGARSGTEKAGEFNGKLSRMISRLENKISDRRLGFLFQGGESVLEFDYLNKLAAALFGSSLEKNGGGVKVINFSEVPSDVLPLMVSLIARLAFTLQQWTPADSRHPIALMCDEAHLYIPDRSGVDAADHISIEIFERIAKEGRKYGVSLIAISQRPSEVNKTILSQCSNFISMRLTNADDQAVIKKLLPDSLGGFSEILPTLDTGEALVVGDASLLPSRIRVDEPSKKPNSGTVDFWNRWQNDVEGNRIGVAIENWRRQTIQ